MNYDMEKLYRELINDHFKNPRNKGLKNDGLKMHKRERTFRPGEFFIRKNFTLVELLINDACFTWVYVLY